MAIDEASPTDKSKLIWTQGESQEPLATFLERNPPSTTRRAAGGDGWIWVRSTRSATTGDGARAQPTEASLREAKALLEALSQRMDEIEANPSIPKVKSKTSGPSKKMLKETAAQHCEGELRRIGEAEWQCGKWMFFESGDYVNRTFSKLAQSLIDGPLSKLEHARCHTVKVATADSQRTDSSRSGRPPQQLICVYFENFWKQQHATEVLECIVKQHGEIPSSAKADLYTMIGLDSNHPTRIRSTLYRPGELFNWDLMREWQSSFIDSLKSKKEATDANQGREASSSTKSASEHELDQGSSDIRATKARKVGLDTDRVPVAPNDFWPSPSGSSKAAAPSKEKTPAQPIAAADDSETESESDFEPSKPSKAAAASTVKKSIKPSTPPPSSSAAAAAAKTQTPHTPSSSVTASPQTPSKRNNGKPEPQASLHRERLASASRSPDEKIKKTPAVVIRSKKRDRFGRSDF